MASTLYSSGDCAGHSGDYAVLAAGTLSSSGDCAVLAASTLSSTGDCAVLAAGATLFRI